MTAGCERACGCECVCLCARAHERCALARGLPIFLLTAVSWELERGRGRRRQRAPSLRRLSWVRALTLSLGASRCHSDCEGTSHDPPGSSVARWGQHLGVAPDGNGQRLRPSGTRAGRGEGTMALTPQRGSSSGLSRPELWLLLWAAAWRLGATACPALCTCTGTTVDCHGTGLQAIPKNIPRNTERL